MDALIPSGRHSCSGSLVFPRSGDLSLEPGFSGADKQRQWSAENGWITRFGGLFTR